MSPTLLETGRIIGTQQSSLLQFRYRVLVSSPGLCKHEHAISCPDNTCSLNEPKLNVLVYMEQPFRLMKTYLFRSCTLLLKHILMVSNKLFKLGLIDRLSRFLIEHARFVALLIRCCSTIIVMVTTPSHYYSSMSMCTKQVDLSYNFNCRYKNTVYAIVLSSNRMGPWKRTPVSYAGHPKHKVGHSLPGPVAKLTDQTHISTLKYGTWLLVRVSGSTFSIKMKIVKKYHKNY